MRAADLVVGTVALALLLAPGWMLARAARLPVPLASGVVVGVVGMVSLLILFDTFGVPIMLATIGGAWMTLLAASAFCCRGRLRENPPRGRTEWRQHWPLLLPLVPAFAVVIYRATTQPLFGIDTIFRWNYLAERILTEASLAFYPPVTPAHFELYGWPDGIAPAVSGLYFWAYALGRGARPLLTAPIVIAQFCALVLVVRALARNVTSERAAAGAGALLACSPLVMWSTAMGQETGLTALAAVALLLYLPQERNAETTGSLLLAGGAAAMGSLAREYGLVFPLIGLTLCGVRRLSRRAWFIFGSVVLLGAVPWYLRNWIRTGNPLYNLELGGIFSVNKVHALLVEGFRADFGWAHLSAEAPRLVAVNCVAGLVGGIAAAAFSARRNAALIGTAFVVIACWAVSVPYTAAGFTYSLRVLSPALALAAVLGGVALARWLPTGASLVGVSFGLTLFATDAALRALTLPANVYRLPSGSWPRVGNAVHAYHARPVYRELAGVVGRERLLVLGPDALLARQGARTIPLWSPEVKFLFEDGLAPLEIARRLRAAGIGFALLNRGPVNEHFLAHSAFFRDPAGTLVPVWSDDDMILLRVVAEPRP